jgi:quaternary ammonium compound-resistance protein SugE
MRAGYKAGMAWIILILAGLCEIVWAVLARYSKGFTQLWPSVGTLAFNIASVALLMLAMKRLPLGTSYAVWTGIGAVGAVLWGIFVFNEPRDWPRLLCIALIIVGIIGLKFVERAAG